MELTKDFVAKCKSVTLLRDFLCQAIDQVDAKEARIKELENEVDAVKMNSGYVAFMEAQARIKELEAKVEKEYDFGYREGIDHAMRDM